MDFLSFSGFINFILSTGVALFIFFSRKRTTLNILFSCFAFAVSFYSLGYLLWQTSLSYEMALFWFKFLMTAVIIGNAFFLHFVSLLLNLFNQKKKIIFYSYLISIIFVPLNITSHLYIKLEPRYDLGLWPVPTGYFHIYLIFWFSQVFYAFYLVIKSLIKASDKERKQIRFFLIATGIGYFGGATNWFMWYNIPFPPYPNILVSVYPIVIAYAVFKHQFFGLDMVIRKTLGYSLAIASLSTIFVIILFLLSRLFGLLSPQHNIWLMTLIVATFAIIFQPILRWSSIQIDRLFFKGTLPDVSSEKEEIEKALRKEQEQAVRNRLNVITSMAYGLADRINNYLFGMNAFLDNLPVKIEEIGGNLNSIKGESLKVLYSASYRGLDKMIKLSREIAGMCRVPEHNFQLYNPKTIFDIADEVIEILKPETQNRIIEINKTLKNNNLPFVYFDRDAVKKVLRHIMQNSIHAISEASIGRKGSISIEIDRTATKYKKEYMTISITDNGTGISKKNIKNVFNPFFTTKGTAGGLGLGLTTCQFIINQHGGKMRMAHTELDKGTTMQFDLPIKGEPPKYPVYPNDILG